MAVLVVALVAVWVAATRQTRAPATAAVPRSVGAAAAGARAAEADELPLPPATGPFVAAMQHLHRAKGPVEPGSWIAVTNEPGQTFAEYRRARARPAPGLTTLYLQPVGELESVHEQPLRDLETLVSTFYAAPATTLLPLPLAAVPNYARRRRQGSVQLSTHYILERLLLPARPDDALAVLAITPSDLSPGDGWNFVFGQASLDERVGVWSFHRYGDPTEGDAALALFRRRLFKVALHEIGHMFGMGHCTAYACLMNGSNHLAEMDHQPMWLCPECVQKIAHARGVSPAERYRRLARFARENGLAREADFWRKSAEAAKAARVPGSSFRSAKSNGDD